MSKIAKTVGKILAGIGGGALTAVGYSKLKEGKRRKAAMKRDLEINNSVARKEV